MNTQSAEPSYILLSGKYIGAGDRFRVSYVENGIVKVVIAHDASDWEISKAIMANRTAKS